MWCNKNCCHLIWGNALDEPHGGAVAVPERLRRRADFLRAAKGKRFHARGLTLQAAARVFPAGSTLNQRGDQGGLAPCEDSLPRFGFTVTKQFGGAVQRNLIRRRLKEALRLIEPLPARRGHDYVILARPEALAMSFGALQGEIMRALGKIDTADPPRMRQDHRRNKPVSGGAGEARQKSSKGRTPKG